MDQNHAPPSPLRQHRPSSRHANQGSSGSSTSADAIDNKLKNPVGLHRPSTSCTSPTTVSPPTSLTPWSGAQEASSSTAAAASSSSSTSATSSSSMTWQESEEAAVERWRAQAHASSSSSVAPSSTSRCPSPHHVPIDMTDSPQPYASSSTSSSLLTSEPLNRTVSANPSPILQPPQPSSSSSPLRKKRARASSLPNATPIFKRRKSKHDTPTPSETWQRTYETGRSSPSKIERQKAAAAELGRVLRSNRNVRAAATQEQHCLVACRQPAINVNSLRSLDASEILKNPQLRHDLLFDSLAFRPVNLPYEAPAKPGYAEIVTGGKTPVVDPRASSFVADMYWDSIAEEIATGCRCVRWKMPKNQDKPNDKFERITECLCGRWRRDLNETEWWTRITVWPTRIPELIRTLREILVSLMGSTTPCPNHFAHSFSREALEAHEAVCPTVTHALVPELYAALDPEFLTLQVRRGVFDLQLFEKLGEAMKVHCAPVRDEMVDDMVRTALSGDVSKGLRKCFDCAEVMKLDIANHQVHALRPYLWDNANQYEFAAFQNMLGSAKVPIVESRTRQWINSASRQVLASAAPQYRPHLIGRCVCKNNMELVHRSLVGGFLDLVFADWTSGSATWPPLVQRRTMGANGIPVLETPVKSPVEIPESLKMDSRRIRDFNAECIDIAITNIVLRAVKDKFLEVHSPRKISSEVVSAFLERTQSDIEWTMDKIASSATATTESVDTTAANAALLSDLGFRLALRVLRPAHIEQQPSPNKSEMQAISQMSQGFNDILQTVISRESPLVASTLSHVRCYLSKVLTGVLLGYRVNPTSTFYDANAGKCLRRNNSISTATAALTMDSSEDEGSTSVGRTGPMSTARETRERHEAYIAEHEEEKLSLLKTLELDGVAEALSDITERMIKIIAFNLSVFRDVYAGPGMMVGS
ncbi:hypothetical protein IAU59_004809 [Kwoniella sp. CBS 9459]